MILTQENIVHYLIDKNFVTAQTVVNGDFMVQDITRRNRNFKIILKNQKGLFVKQVKNWDAQSVNSLSREATSYSLAQHDENFNGLKQLMPNLIYHDRQRNIIILELFSQSENLSEMHIRLGTFPIDIASSLALSLGTYHKKVSLSIDKVKEKKIFPQALPWMLTVNQQYLQQVKNVDANHFQFFSIIDKYPEFLTSIEQLRNQWQTNSLIHGDMKWDNCLVYKEDNNPNLQLKIIDWELADLGDSAWDVGAIFQTYLSLWVMSIPALQNNNAQQAIPFAKYKIDDMQPAIKQFWNTYTYTMQFEKQNQANQLLKCTQYAAVRMVQTVYEQVHFTKQLTQSGVYLLQLSLNILKNPAEATSALLGL
jgi:thiamine kinase-like enzyme